MERLFSPTAFQGQVVLVTGGAQGIGLAIVEAFAKLGGLVIVVDLQRQKAQQVATSLTEQGYHVDAESCDCSVQQRISALVAKIEREYHRLDIVVHNAAYFPLTDFMQIDEPLLQKTLSVNLIAPFYLTQAAQPLMKKQGGGRILITSSVTGPKVAYPGLAHYAASKAGVNGFIKAAALELAPFGITVNGVEPGMIRTPAMANLGDEQLNQSIARNVPLGRLGEGEDIAAAMVFLASPVASYITGQTIVVDGGALLPETTI
ncbi:SDR family oxidoreductase [Providencia manganoxydans]|uniref:SDR family oxidoreductase n=1 Tax=Providencia manganoxydans TaxID=2923283 RepID=A0ABX7AFP0_9GAMM|nr:MULTISPECIES: SDR family oxidoreductase [Providencia]MDX4946605.1 SDR family oxidoreductase [Providencia manganoxydans]QQO62771.1 SDR family oxidoreductase [Providencia manganoxydans]HEF8773125.1 SDR family oxidoreductase [Providencia stuartii]